MREIFEERAYNVGVSKYKLLSSISGPGSIIPSIFGTYVIVLDINKWKFIRWSSKKLKNLSTNDHGENTDALIKKELSYRGLQCIDDSRFIKFLRKEKELTNLKSLIRIPHLTLSENFNTPNWKESPYRRVAEENEEYVNEEDYMVFAKHFPRWFKSSRGGALKTLESWSSLWNETCKKEKALKQKHFFPPRDTTQPPIGQISVFDEDRNRIKINRYRQLDQISLVLICPKGHLSDIPWAKYLRWKSENTIQSNADNDKLIDILQWDDCCENPNLLWQESKTKTENIGDIRIKCKNCELSENLEGLSELRFRCTGEKPWEEKPKGHDRFSNKNKTPAESCFQGYMRVAPVTAKFIYYADFLSSIYIPPKYLSYNNRNKTDVIINQIVENLNKQYVEMLERFNAEIPKEKYLGIMPIEDVLRDKGILKESKTLVYRIKNAFLNEAKTHTIPKATSDDPQRNYLFEEFKYFSTEEFSDEEGLKFRSKDMPKPFTKHFNKILSIEELKLTVVQLGFTRIKPPERVIKNEKEGYKETPQNIFQGPKEKVVVLPAIEMKGEGLFFNFSKKELSKWKKEHNKKLNERFKDVYNRINDTKNYGVLKHEIKGNLEKFYLIHSFSHMLMKELEFYCGYPTSSLKERLYISEELEMFGFLIYTAEGSEGSMGGLASQGEQDNLAKILKSGLRRIKNCSSDPLCWLEEGQSIEKLNLSACFSCSLISETSCEKMNLGLDRRVLIDPEFGFFREFV
ncbi:MAG: DUF1998 domain-containing protein [Flavobacteriaceae bacterium]|nr:DUF1998 domain-containing protein [Flavobacteriaceae bacterium]MCY4267578.1 DUF1998 domain-containing protein [Flavobacteriaceae bacterium]